LKSKKLFLLAHIVKGRKGHYRELFQQIRKSGYTKVRIDGDVHDITAKMQVDRYKIHDIEIVMDRIVTDVKDRARIGQSINKSLKEGKGVMMVMEENGKVHHFSKFLMDPKTGLAYDEPAPNTFSFNSPYGACPTCNGLGQIEEITKESVIPDASISISRGGILPPHRARCGSKFDSMLGSGLLTPSTGPTEWSPPFCWARVSGPRPPISRTRSRRRPAVRRFGEVGDPRRTCIRQRLGESP
jgi:excinuclease UvrABC ATPase subunit